MFKNIYKEWAAPKEAIEEATKKDEGNAFTAALMAARKNGDSHFVVAGKRYKCEDYDDEGNVKEGKMDPVNKKELKKDFDDRKDKDVDNDGDVDASDKYLVKRRKAISKATSKDKPVVGGKDDTAVMNPKKDDKMAKETKESTIRDKLMSIWETAAQTKGATKPDEQPTDRNASAKKMKDGHGKPEMDDTEEKGHDDASKAGRAVASQAKARNNGDNTTTGDRNIVNKIAAAYKGMQK